MNIIEEYTKKESLRRAKLIEGNFYLVVKEKPKYVPNWLYKKIIRNSVEIVQLNK